MTYSNIITLPLGRTDKEREIRKEIDKEGKGNYDKLDPMYEPPQEGEESIRIDLRGHFSGQSDETDAQVKHGIFRLQTFLQRSLDTALLMQNLTRYLLKDAQEKLAKGIAKEDLSELERKALASSEDENNDRPKQIHFSTVNCSTCGRYLENLIRDEDDVNFYRVERECPVPGGLGRYSFLLNVPSGKVVFANDLRSICDGEPNYYVNYAIEVFYTTMAYADLGMAHISVGNSCPGVYKTPDGGIIVANFPYKESIEGWDWDNDANPDENQVLPKNYRKVGSICTDLWWYSAMDYDFFVQQQLKYHPDTNLEKLESSWGIDIVDVEPGCYEIDDLRYTKGFDADDYENPTIYSTWKRVGPCRELPIQSDYVKTAKYMETPKRLCEAEAAVWCRLDGGEVGKANVVSLLDRIFCSRNEWKGGRIVSVSSKHQDYVKGIENGTIQPPTFISDSKNALTAGMWVSSCRSMLPICNVPDDVTDEWLLALIWFYDTVLASERPPQYRKKYNFFYKRYDKEEYEDVENTWARYWDEYQENTPKLREELLERFGTRLQDLGYTPSFVPKFPWDYQNNDERR